MRKERMMDGVMWITYTVIFGVQAAIYVKIRDYIALQNWIVLGLLISGALMILSSQLKQWEMLERRGEYKGPMY